MRHHVTDDIARLELADRLTAYLQRRLRDHEGLEAPIVACTAKQVRNKLTYEINRIQSKDAEERFRRKYADRGVQAMDLEDGTASLTIGSSIDQGSTTATPGRWGPRPRRTSSRPARPTTRRRLPRFQHRRGRRRVPGVAAAAGFRHDVRRTDHPSSSVWPDLPEIQFSATELIDVLTELRERRDIETAEREALDWEHAIARSLQELLAGC